MLSVPSTWSYASEIDCEVHASNGSELEFLLEEKLPIDQERFVAGFLASGEKSTLGIAVASESLEGLLEGFESHSIRVEHIVPESLLVLAAALREVEEPFTRVRIDRDDGSFEVLTLEDSTPTSWRYFAPGSAPDSSQSSMPTEGRTLLLGDRCASCGSDLLLETPIEDLAFRETCALLVDSEIPTVDFRRGIFGPRDPWRTVRPARRVFVTALLVALALLAFTFHRRTARYAAIREARNQELTTLFEKTLPGQRVPVSATRRLESRIRELEGLNTGSNDSERSLLEVPSGLETLCQALEHLPESIRLLVLDLHVRDDAVLIRGELREHGDAERVAESLRESDRFRVDSPRTEKLRGEGVGFSLSATLRNPEVLAKGSGEKGAS